MDTLLHLVNFILHIDHFLGDFIRQYGAWVYLVLFVIVFSETGLVVLPFLPGDSLLFIAGAFAAAGQMNLALVLVLMSLAAIIGNSVNYLIGRLFGSRVLEGHVPVLSRLLDRGALQKTHDFYERHGGKTLVLARFVPVVRTFAPFVAGISEMGAVRFQAYNVVGAVAWVLSMALLGYFFGNIPFIRQHINLIALIGAASAAVPVVLGGVVKMVRGKAQGQRG